VKRLCSVARLKASFCHLSLVAHLMVVCVLVQSAMPAYETLLPSPDQAMASERGFDTYLRATSVPERQEVTPHQRWHGNCFYSFYIVQRILQAVAGSRRGTLSIRCPGRSGCSGCSADVPKHRTRDHACSM
jgi:hypothetical protein